jgi:hypothetical protein
MLCGLDIFGLKWIRFPFTRRGFRKCLHHDLFVLLQCFPAGRTRLQVFSQETFLFNGSLIGCSHRAQMVKIFVGWIG